MSTEGFDTMAPGDEEVFAGLRRSVGGATLPAGAADVVALGRRTRNRHRAVAAGIGTSAAALVAAIGVLAPSAGSGAGSAPNAVGSRLLNIQAAGFSVEERTDGTVHLTLKEIFDPAALQAALDRAGVPSAILVAKTTENFAPGRHFQCVPDPGVRFGGTFDNDIVTPSRTPQAVFDIHKPLIPAGDFVTVTQLQAPDGQKMTSLQLNVGRQKTCVPEIVSTSGRPGR